MKGDFSRSTFDRERHFSKVLMQQGRVQMDADWNEQQDLTLNRIETETRDVIGVTGGPRNGAGFKILPGSLLSGQPVTPVSQQLEIADTERISTFGQNELVISAGRYYVDGILCENETNVSYALQPGLPGSLAITTAGTYLAYLDVWSRHITALEDSQIREVALDGPDTATRVQTVWQVRLAALGGLGMNIACSAADRLAGVSQAAPGRLAARASAAAVSNDPCIVAPGAGFRRLENQLYRVEVHDGGLLGTAKFKWSRENGSIVTRWESRNGNDLTVSSIGRDKVLNFASGQLVELTDDTRDLLGKPGTLVRLIKAEGQVLTIDPATATGSVEWTDFPKNPRVRRWEGLLTTNSNWLPLEDGVEIKFTPAGFNTGDYWMIPARTATADVEWPQDTVTNLPAAKLPDGIQHHYCNLALLTFNNGVWTPLSDCRKIFPPLTELTSFLIAGGDGQEAMPDFSPDTPFPPPETTGAGGEITERRAAAFTPLPQKIEVAVANGQWPVPGAVVRFRIVDQPDGGRLIGGAPVVTGREVRVATDASGIAASEWHLGSSPHSQRVEAVLLKDDGNPLEIHPIHFNANLSVADQVAYDPTGCGSLSTTKTVQDAINRLSSLVSLFEVSGNNQSGEPNHQLIEPLVVVAASKCGPVAKPGPMNVTFNVIRGHGSVVSISPISANTAGQFACLWTLGLEGPQVVEAVLTSADPSLIVPPTTVRFTARLAEPEPDPGFHVTGLFFHAGASALLAPLRNDMEVDVSRLKNGLEVHFDEAVLEESFVGKPVCFVTLEIPFFHQLTVSSKALVGFLPVKLDAGLRYGLKPGGFETQFEATTSSAKANSAIGIPPFVPDHKKIVWSPSDGDRLIAWIQSVLASLAGTGKTRLLGKLTLKGSSILSESRPDVYLDGEAFALLHSPDHDLLFSGDKKPGGDMEAWFWVTPGPGRAIMSIDKTELNFGQLTRSMSSAQIFTIRNIGTASFELRNIRKSGDSAFTFSAGFVESFRPGDAGEVARTSVPSTGPGGLEPSQPFPMTIGPQEGVTVTVQFSCAATSGASPTGTLTIETDPSVSGGPVNLQGSCLQIVVPPKAICQTTPNVMPFAAVEGESETRSAKITNTGEVPFKLLSVGVILDAAPGTQPPSGREGSGASPFSTVDPTSNLAIVVQPVVLNKRESQSVTVKYQRRPNTAGIESGSLVFTTDTPTPACADIRLTGTGIVFASTPSVEVSGTDIDFGTQNRTSVAGRDVVVRNSGTAKLEVKASASQPHLKVSPEQATIDPGGSQTFNVSFAGSAVPATEKPGVKTGAITITTNDPANPIVAAPVKWTLAAEAVKNPILGISVKELDLGALTRATAGDRTTVKIQNTGTARLEVSASTDQQVLTVSQKQMSLDPGGSQDFLVSFVGTLIPANETAGAKTAHIMISSNDPTQPSVLVPVKWTLTTPVLSLLGNEFDFGKVTRATTATNNKVTILNTGDAQLQVKLSLDSLHNSVSPREAAIEPGGSQNLGVSFVGSKIPATQKDGPNTATVVITTNDPLRPTVSAAVKWDLTSEPAKSPVLDLAVKEIELGGLSRQTTGGGANLKIQNTGNARLEVGASSDQPFFGVPRKQMSIDPGGSQVLAISFNGLLLPADEKPGAKTAIIRITSNDPAQQTVSLPMKWTLTMPALTLSANEIDFGRVTRATAANNKLAVRNSGNGRLDIKMSPSTANIGLAPREAALLPGSSQTFDVSFAGSAIPATEKDGAQIASITITSNDDLKPTVSVPVKWILASEPVKPILNLSAKEIDFGAVTRATAGVKVSIQIQNSGDGRLDVEAATDQPLLTVSPKQMSIDPGNSQNLTVSFTGTLIPANEKPGAKTAAIAIISNDPAKPNLAVSVKWNLTSERGKNPKGRQPSAARDKPKR